MLLRTRQPGHWLMKPDCRLDILHGIHPPLESGEAAAIPDASRPAGSPIAASPSPDVPVNGGASAA